MIMMSTFKNDHRKLLMILPDFDSVGPDLLVSSSLALFLTLWNSLSGPCVTA